MWGTAPALRSGHVPRSPCGRPSSCCLPSTSSTAALGDLSCPRARTF